MHICVVRLSAIGDVILTVPVVRAIQADMPQARITWITGRAAYEILKDLSGVEFVVIDKPRSLKDYFRFWRLIRGNQFDVLLALQASLRTNLLYPLIRAKRKVGFDKRRARDGHRCFVKEAIAFKEQHLLEGFLEFAKHIGVNITSAPTWQLAIPQTDYDWVLEHLSSPYIVINPAASKAERNWPIGNYVLLIQKIQNQYPEINIVLTGAPNDQHIAKQITSQVEVVNLIGQTSLKQLAAVLDKAIVLIAPDTGPAHIATAMNTPVIGLYAVITSRLSGPYLSQHLCIDKYPEALKNYLNQDIETVKWGTRVHNAKAMGLISVDAVLEKVSLTLVGEARSQLDGKAN